MKTRHSPNLYEILRSAAGPSAPAAPALKLSDAHTSGPAAVVAPPPPPPPAVREPEPVEKISPPPLLPPEPARVMRASESRPSGPAPRAVESHLTSSVFSAPASTSFDRTAPPAPAGPGERAVRVTYNTLLFGGLVALGVVFLSFTLGVRTGRARAEAASATPELETAAPAAPAGPAPTFTIRLIEYRARTSQEYTKALDAAIRYKNELERLGLREGVVETLGLTPDRRVVLRYGEYADAAAAPARETLKKLQSLKLDRGAKDATFLKTAQFQTR